MKGGRKKTPNSFGFTIIEVMMFLAISGLMFVVAAEFINGKESQTQFTQGMNATNADIRTSINDVANGNYPTFNSYGFDCTPTVNGPLVNTSGNPTTTPGCSYVGKILIPETNGNPAEYTQYSVVGCQFFDPISFGCSASSDDIPTTLQQERPQVIILSGESGLWPGGVNIYKMYEVVGGSASAIGAVGFFGSLPSVNSGILVSGAQPVSIVVFPSSLSDSTGQITTDVNNLSNYGNPGGFLNNGYIVMCFNGVNGKKGSITIGGSSGGNQTVTDLEMGNGISTLC